jgi:hypothetical protein
VADGECHSLNVHAQSEQKCDDSKDSCSDELEQVLDHFPKFCLFSWRYNPLWLYFPQSGSVL